MLRYSIILFFLVFQSLFSFAENRVAEAFHRSISDYFPSLEYQEVANAAAIGDLATLQKAKESGTNLDYLGNFGLTPLAWAVGAGSVSGSEFLLKNGAIPNRSFETSTSILTLSIAIKNPVLLRMLISFGGDPIWRDENCQSAISYSMFYEISYLEICLEPIQKVNIMTAINHPLEIAIRLRDYRKARMLLEKGIDVTFFDEISKGRLEELVHRVYATRSNNPDFRISLELLQKQKIGLDLKQ